LQAPSPSPSPSPSQTAGLGEVCEVCGSRRHAQVTHKRGRGIHRCFDCGLFFVHPQPSDAELAAIYSTGSGYFAAAARDLAASSPLRARQLHATFARFGLRPPGRFLDVGCATGNIPFHMRELGWQVAGNDLNAGALEVARSHGLDVRHGSLEACAFEDASFEAANLGDLIEHVRSPRALLRELARILAPGGLAVIVTPNAESGFGRGSLLLSRLAGVSWAHSQAPYHLYEFSPANLQQLVREAGFAIEELSIEGSGSFPYLVGATGYFDELKNELKASGGYRLTPRVIRELPKLAAVSGSLFPLWLWGRVSDRPRGSGRIMTLVARRR
jgi:SAM-dependent methyltransferase